MDRIVLQDQMKNGQTKVWSIEVSSAAVIMQRHGQLGGKMVEHSRTVSTGKNIGRSNETTPLQQAISEAKAILLKKEKSGYKRADCDSGDNGVGNGETLKIKIPAKEAAPLLPMLAKDYTKDGKKIVFPAFCQPKVDGVRAVFRGGVFTSRTGNEFLDLDYIARDIGHTDIILDGELYSYDLTFEQLVGLVKKQKKTPDDLSKLRNCVKFLVFDVIDANLDFEQRHALLRMHLLNTASVKTLETKEILSKDDVQAFHDEYVEQGMEGLMLRNKRGSYKIKYRSADVQKYKNFQDGEFKIIGFTEGAGCESGCIIFELATENDGKFKARPRGTHESRKELFARGKSFIGQMATVRYQNLSSDGIPRFPVFIAPRDGY